MLIRNLLVFVAALIIGVGFVSSGQIENFFHRECARWDDATRARPLFTFKEGKQLIGKRVSFKNSTPYPHNIGRIWHLERVGQDKYFIVVDWDIDPEKGREIPLLYDKEVLPDLEFVN